MSRVAAAVARAKTRRPGEFCPEPNCLWRTGGEWCPRHAPKDAPVPLPQAATTAPGRAQHPSPAELRTRLKARSASPSGFDRDALRLAWPDADLARDLHREAREEWAQEEAELEQLERDAEDARGGESISE